MFTGIGILVTEIFENVMEHFKLDETIWASVIFVVLAALALIFVVIWLYASFHYSVTSSSSSIPASTLAS